jgi:hypothetical protein
MRLANQRGGGCSESELEHDRSRRTQIALGMVREVLVYRDSDRTYIPSCAKYGTASLLPGGFEYGEQFAQSVEPLPHHSTCTDSYLKAPLMAPRAILKNPFDFPSYIHYQWTA